MIIVHLGNIHKRLTKCRKLIKRLIIILSSICQAKITKSLETPHSLNLTQHSVNL
jgi:hypothetical protein